MGANLPYSSENLLKYSDSGGGGGVHDIMRYGWKSGSQEALVDQFVSVRYVYDLLLAGLYILYCEDDAKCNVYTLYLSKHRFSSIPCKFTGALPYLVS